MMTTDHSETPSGSLKKFLFDTDFSDETPPESLKTPEPEVQAKGEGEPEPEPEFIEEIAPTFSEAEVAAAREEGRQAGREEAIADMTSALEQQIINTLNGINIKVAQMFAIYAKDTEDHSRDAIAVATVIMRKMFPSLNDQHSMAEIETIIIEALQRTSGAPSLLIKVPQDIVEEIAPKVQEMAALRGREDQIKVMADPEMAQGDLRVEWDGGGILRDTSLLWEQIDGIIERNLGASFEDLTKGPEQVPELVPDQVPEQAPEQEVVKQASVSENDGVVVESPNTGETNKEAPAIGGDQPSEEEPRD